MNQKTEIQSARSKFIAMAATYCLGVFNDNYFKQAAMLMAVSAGAGYLQGLAAVLFALPFILFSSAAGWLADRFPKRDVVIWSKGMELLAMLIGAAGVITGNWSCIMTMIFLVGSQAAFFSPALNGSIPELYPVDYIPKANALLKLVTTLSILAGIALAGVSLDQKWLRIGNLDPGAVLVALVVVLAAGFGLAASLGVHKRPAAGKGTPFPWLGPISSLKDLISICSDRQMLIAFFSDNFFYFLATLVVMAINAIGLRQLGFSQTATSLLSVSLMVGVCIGSFPAARFITIERWSDWLGRSAVGMAVGLFMAGITPLVPPGARLPWIAIGLTTTGVFGGLFLIPVASFLQARPAASEKGKVLGAVNFSCFVGIVFAGVVFTALDAMLPPAGIMIFLGCTALFAGWMIHKVKHPGFTPHQQLLHRFVRFIIRLRYRIEVKGIESIRDGEAKRIIFLPNHPALIDPVIVMSVLYPDFKPRPLVDADQANLPFVRWIMRFIRPITLPDLTKNGRGSRDRVKEALAEVVKGLLDGDNILFYPAGRLCRTNMEDLAGNSGVEYVLKHVPDVRTVLVRTTGLWGSSFGWGRGTEPSLLANFRRYLTFACANGLFFGPRRKVTIELVEETELGKLEGRKQINAALEAFYNAFRSPNTHVPYYWWQGDAPRILPEPEKKRIKGDIGSIPEATRRLIKSKIGEMAGRAVEDGNRLSADLAMDSLMVTELSVWLETEFGFPVEDLSALETVNDCILAASGQSSAAAPVPKKAVPGKWFEGKGDPLPFGLQTTVTELFLDQAIRHPNRLIIADALSGTRTYRQVTTAVLVLRPIIEKLPGECVGIMMPASVGAAVLYMAALFSGKTPVMINWTVGVGNIRHGLALTGVKTVITARSLYRRLSAQGISLSEVPTEWRFLEEIIPSISLWKKGMAALRARFPRSSLGKRPVSKSVVILFTSGSESRPKAVPLTHDNIISNLRDFSSIVTFAGNDRLLGMLPPFHSLGLVGTIILPLCLGMKTVYHANPTEGAILAGMIERYGVSIVIGTPTFLAGILRTATAEQLRTLQRVFTGAEKCADYIHESLKKINPAAILCEGYGITECSPLVSVNRLDDNRPGSIGQVMPSMEYVIINPDTGRCVETGEQGILLVRGPNIFGGYLGDDNGKGFYEFDNKRWYDTGDFVREETGPSLVFCGRKKRFVKLGGEMISLPAIENALLAHFPTNGEKGPALAVEATPSEERPEIVLFTTLPLTREEANALIQSAGLSPLHNIRMLNKMDIIPVLGTGKTDYRQLRLLLAGGLA